MAKTQEDFEVLDKTYREFMALEAPVQYWSTKAGVHNKRMKIAFGASVFIFVAAAVLLSFVYKQIGETLGSQSITPGEIAAILSIGVVSTTAAFWVVRLCIRTWMSERHLRTESEEKETFIKTYLALTKNAAAEENDRQIVLAAIFKGTADGIVRDEGPPDVSIPAIVSRVLSK
jgi:hypothetical protein